MAERPVFIPTEAAPFSRAVPVRFVWNGGFARSQKQKNIVAIHEGFRRKFPEKNVLEISSKSLQELGVSLSAFNLTKYVPSLGRSVPVECVYQGGKVFSGGGPFTELYGGTPKAAKTDPRLAESGVLCEFFFEGEHMPLSPKTAFYNWLYINALMEHPEYSEQLLQYDGFTDIEFIPDAGVSCQADAAAVFVALHRAGRLEQCRGYEGYCAAVSGRV